MAFAGPAVDRAAAALASLGLKVEFSENCYDISEDGISAGDARARANDINDAFKDPGVDCIISAVGGTTTHEVLPYLDAEVIAANPKIFIGRSDNVHLNAYLFEQAGLISFYGSTFLPQFGLFPRPILENISSFATVLMAGLPGGVSIPQMAFCPYD